MPNHGVAKEDFLPITEEELNDTLDQLKVKKIHPSELSWSRLMLTIAERYPELFKKFYPRQYRDVGAYYSPKQIAAALTAVTADVPRTGIDNAPIAITLMLPALKPMIDQQMPMMFIAPKLLEAVQHTDFKDDIDWTTMKLPYEHGIFVLPTGGFKHPNDGDVAFVVYSRVTPGMYDPPPLFGIPKMSIPDTSFAIVALCPGAGVWYDANLSAKMRPTLRLNNLFYREDGDSTSPRIGPKRSALDEDLSEIDAPFLEKLGVVVFGTLMAMSARPGLSVPAHKLHTSQRRDKPVVWWSPNIIGRDYKPKSAPQGGTHASPRMHWRRGHFREQACGVGQKDRKTIWLEPCLISAASK